MIFSKTLAAFLKDLGMTRTRVDSTLFSYVNPDTGAWKSDAEVADTTYTALDSSRGLRRRFIDHRK